MTARDNEFSSVFRAEYRFVCRSLRRLGVADADADDVAHELFVTTYRKFDTYDPARSTIRVWLFAFALRFASRYRRQSVRTGPIKPVDEAIADQYPDAEAQLASNEDRLLVLAVLDRLADDRRAVLVMYELSDFSIEEIASTMKIPINTAYSKLRAARHDFKRAVQRIQIQRGER